MIASMKPVQRVILYEGAPAKPFEPTSKFELLQALLKRGFSASIARSGDEISKHSDQTLVILGQFDGVAESELPTSGNAAEWRCRDISGQPAAEVVQLVEESCQEIGSGAADGWKPWFPVIDFDRCTNCMQCLSFCLFDVYGVTPGGQITVQNESNCKTDCPACSRVCPEVAILFPKYKAGPINGDEVSAEDVRREAMKVDISALLGGDIYAMLRDRSAKAKSRFSRERDDERALKERQRCLTKLKEAADVEIPPEVMASLPSADQIQQKAREAKKRAEAALAQAKNANPEQ